MEKNNLGDYPEWHVISGKREIWGQDRNFARKHIESCKDNTGEIPILSP